MCIVGTQTKNLRGRWVIRLEMNIWWQVGQGWVFAFMQTVVEGYCLQIAETTGCPMFKCVQLHRPVAIMNLQVVTPEESAKLGTYDALDLKRHYEWLQMHAHLGVQSVCTVHDACEMRGSSATVPANSCEWAAPDSSVIAPTGCLAATHGTLRRPCRRQLLI
jgi:hypothetical protein